MQKALHIVRGFFNMCGAIYQTAATDKHSKMSYYTKCKMSVPFILIIGAQRQTSNLFFKRTHRCSNTC